MTTPMDTKNAWMYIKYRGVQLENTKGATDTSPGDIDQETKLVSLDTGLAKINTSSIKAYFAFMKSKIPGPVSTVGG